MTKFVHLDSDGHLIRIETEETDKHYVHPIKVFKDEAKADILTVDEQKELRDRARDAGFMAGLVAATALGKPTSTEPECLSIEDYRNGFINGRTSMKREILAKISLIDSEKKC